MPLGDRVYLVIDAPADLNLLWLLGCLLGCSVYGRSGRPDGGRSLAFFEHVRRLITRTGDPQRAREQWAAVWGARLRDRAAALTAGAQPPGLPSEEWVPPNMIELRRAVAEVRGCFDGWWDGALGARFACEYFTDVALAQTPDVKSLLGESTPVYVDVVGGEDAFAGSGRHRVIGTMGLARPSRFRACLESLRPPDARA